MGRTYRKYVRSDWTYKIDLKQVSWKTVYNLKQQAVAGKVHTKQEFIETIYTVDTRDTCDPGDIVDIVDTGDTGEYTVVLESRPGPFTRQRDQGSRGRTSRGRRKRKKRRLQKLTLRRAEHVDFKLALKKKLPPRTHAQNVYKLYGEVCNRTINQTKRSYDRTQKCDRTTRHGKKSHFWCPVHSMYICAHCFGKCISCYPDEVNSPTGCK